MRACRPSKTAVSRIHSANKLLVLVYCSAFIGIGCHCNSENDSSLPTPGNTLAVADFQRNATSTMTGSVFFEGTPTEPRVWNTSSSDPACRHAGREVMASEEVIVNTNSTLRHVFVYISSSLGPLQFPLPSEPVILNQRGCRYTPHVFGIRAGQTLLILNSDSTMHNVHASPRRNRAFNAGMTAVMKKLTRSFEQPEVMIPFNCNVHPWMTAYAGVLQHPFFAVTSTAGSFELGPLPPGEYEVTAWHERFGELKQIVTLSASERRQVDFTFQTH
jgi:hypothetical protein